MNEVPLLVEGIEVDVDEKGVLDYVQVVVYKFAV